MITGAFLIGVGMGGFLDGILLHQVFQLHNMLSARLPATDMDSMKINMFWDGVFHFGVWIATAVGLGLLWASRQNWQTLTTRQFLGWALVGWGVFNLVEGIANHYVLQLHHVYQAAGLSAWDSAFIVAANIMILVGYAMSRRRP